MTFRFNLGDDVIFKPKGEKGVVAARAEHLGGEIKYLIQKPSGASWANDDAIDPLPPAAKEKAK